MKFILIRIISLYQKNISPLFKRNCMFYPTCSEYSKQAIEKYGVIKGLRLSVARILRCHPWAKSRVDSVK